MNAQRGGADRIELCDNPAEGGTTPSFGVMEIVRQAVSMDVYAMIRPRGGDFVYTAYEYHAMKRDIEMCKRASLDGVVFGILKPDGTLDKDRCKKLIDAARPMKVTCHRAFDVTRDPFEALEACIEVGFDRILTSGQAQTAPEGLNLIKALVEKAGNRISIMPGSGIHEGNAKQIIDGTGAKEIHFSAKAFQVSEYQSNIRFTDALPEQMGKFVTDPEKVRMVMELLKT